MPSNDEISLPTRGRATRSWDPAFVVSGVGFSAKVGNTVGRVLLSGQRGEGDVQGVPGLHIECKRQEQTRLQEWFEHERPKADGNPLAIIHKKNRGPIMVTMLLDDWLDLFRVALNDG